MIQDSKNTGLAITLKIAESKSMNSQTFLITKVLSPGSSSSGVGGRGLFGAPPLILEEGPGRTQLVSELDKNSFY